MNGDLCVMSAENFCARAEENISELVFQSTDVKLIAAQWSIGDSASPSSSLMGLSPDGNGQTQRNYLTNNEKAKEAISRAGKRNAVKGWPPSGPLSQ